MKRILLLALLLPVSACSTIGWYSQSIGGHLGIMFRQQPIDEIIESPHTTDELKQKLTRIQTIREYASKKLQLPENNSFNTYADLGRPYVLWNVVAAPEFSLTPETWCYPVVGCASYRGYYSHPAALEKQQELAARGLDVKVGGVPAYSTLGWFDDPILNTFINWPETNIAGLIFHELSHQVVYIKNDTSFNESFAHSVELIGMLQWLKQTQPEKLEQWMQQQTAREQSFELKMEIRQKLQDLYQQALPEHEKRRQKKLIFDGITPRFAQLIQQQPELAPWKNWFGAANNNAWFVASFDYEQHVAAFIQLFVNSNQDWTLFFSNVKKLSKLEPEKRNDRLAALAKTKLTLSSMLWN